MKRVILTVLVAALGAISFEANAQDRSFTDPNGFQGVETPGGYEPANAPLPAGTPANAKIITRASLSPSIAYTPPPPAQTYPRCTAQRHDACQQRK